MLTDDEIGDIKNANPVSERFEANSGIVVEVIYYGWIGPSAIILQFLRKIPMIQRHKGLNPSGQQCVDQSVVVVDTLAVHLALCAVRKNSRPGQGEPVIR